VARVVLENGDQEAGLGDDLETPGEEQLAMEPETE
jgi:hypothetical protein